MTEIDYDKCKGECGNVSYKDLTRLLKCQQRWIAKVQKTLVSQDETIKHLKAKLHFHQRIMKGIINQRQKEENDKAKKPTKGKK